MRAKRRLSGRALVVAALLAFVNLLSMTGSASADPYWQVYLFTLKFHCTDRDEDWHDVGYNAVGRACIVVNGNSVQAVATAINYENVPHEIEATDVKLYVNGQLIYDRHCYRSNLAAGEGANCYAPTNSYPCGTYVQAFVTLYHGVTPKEIWSPTKTACVT
ncbi:hypothetical protein [Actinokineospora fastidiosa]|uniref:Secreted protein n=1 Tax=Actinokineospora fastidiosa TaxID=1816 RepID=A0A918L9H6_9PSEU|nr:hypothetical protein [Actinokineospora fastidiosa]GGS22797.1 hypothetical protein GCM10010171_14550 [Actinokineospora fastidiosa]